MILVTGGTGLVGSHLLYHLTLKDEKIRAIYRTESSLEKVKKVFSFYTDTIESQFSNIEWFKADITDVPAMTPAFIDVTYVYHCAALISFNPRDYREMRKVNIHGTAIIANLSIAAKVKKLCFVSSIAAVGEAMSGNLVTEECEWNKDLDNSGYSITKYGAEMEIWRASQENIDVVIVNPGVILGSGFWNGGSGHIFTKIHNGFKYYTEGITGFIAVKDVVEAMILLTTSDIKNERFILVNQNLRFKEIFNIIADNLGKKRPYRQIKKWQTQILWRLAWGISLVTGKPPILSKYSASAAHSKSFYSSEKLVKAISFTFTPIEKSIKKIATDFSSKY